MNIDHLEQCVIARRSTDLSGLSPAEQFEHIQWRAKTILPVDALRELLSEKRPLNIKYGIDPTSPDIHLGHMVPVQLARMLQQMGHRITIVFGDFTALVGDPTGRVATRPLLSTEDIGANMQTYTDQIGKILDLNRIHIVQNTEFYQPLSVVGFIHLLRRVSVNQLLQREDFRLRLQSSGLSAAELIYPVLMGYDSVQLEPDIELGGDDQLINFSLTRELMKDFGKKAEVAITTDLLLGISGNGEKMSKSKGNYIALNDSATDIFGKIMSMPDDLLAHFFHLNTDITQEEWEELAQSMSTGTVNPRDAKRLLGRLVVSQLYSPTAAKQVDQGFVATFSNRQVPIDALDFQIPDDGIQLVTLLRESGLAPSNNHARQMIRQGAVRLVGPNQEEKITDPTHLVTPSHRDWAVRYGRHFLHLI